MGHGGHAREAGHARRASPAASLSGHLLCAGAVWSGMPRPPEAACSVHDQAVGRGCVRGGGLRNPPPRIILSLQHVFTPSSSHAHQSKSKSVHARCSLSIAQCSPIQLEVGARKATRYLLLYSLRRSTFFKFPSFAGFTIAHQCLFLKGPFYKLRLS